MERLAELDDARLVAREEKEDAQDRVRVAEAELSRVRDRLADLDDG